MTVPVKKKVKAGSERRALKLNCAAPNNSGPACNAGVVMYCIEKNLNMKHCEVFKLAWNLKPTDVQTTFI